MSNNDKNAKKYYMQKYNEFCELLTKKSSTFSSNQDNEVGKSFQKYDLRFLQEKCVADKNGISFSSAGITEKPLEIHLTEQEIIERFQPVSQFISRNLGLSNISFVILTNNSGPETLSINVKDVLLKTIFFQSINDLDSGLNPALLETQIIVVGEPDQLIHLAVDIPDHPLKNNAAAVLSTGSRLIPHARLKLESEFGVDILDMYSTVESGPVAIECKEHNGTHLLCDHTFLILKDAKENDDSISTGRICLSSNLNPELPLVDYDTDDRGALDFSPCSCGEEAPLLKDLETPLPGITNCYGDDVIISELEHVIEKFPLLQYRLIQYDDHTLLKYRSFPGEHTDEQKMKDALLRVFGKETNLQFDEYGNDTLYRKARWIESKKSKLPQTVGILRSNTGTDFLQIFKALTEMCVKNNNKNQRNKKLIVILPEIENTGFTDKCFSDILGSLINEFELTVVSDPEKPHELDCNYELNTIYIKELRKSVFNSYKNDFILNLGYMIPENSNKAIASGGLYRAFCHNMIKTGAAPELRQLSTELSDRILNVVIVAADINTTPYLYIASTNSLSADRIACEFCRTGFQNNTILADSAELEMHGISLMDIDVCGLKPEASRKPAPMMIGEKKGNRFVVCRSSCDACGICASTCPMSCIELVNDFPEFDYGRCIDCCYCVENCHTTAISPALDRGAGIPGRKFMQKKNYPGNFFPLENNVHGFAPTYQLPATSITTTGKNGPLYILGLSILTMQEHGAALLRDGEIVGCVEEERFRRRKHYGWKPPGGGNRTIANDPLMCIEEPFCMNSISSLLDMEGITLDDVDYIAINGLPHRFRHRDHIEQKGEPLQVVRSGKMVFVPHHLAHAASAFRVSGMKSAGILTVDGSGDRETAAFFIARDGIIHQVYEVPARVDTSIGASYETITDILGFGSHGQGSTMALAAMGEPVYDMSNCFSLNNHKDSRLNFIELHSRFGDFRRSRYGPMAQKHKDLAASAQKALEQVCINLVSEGMAGQDVEGLCMAGGVALNCAMNSAVRKEFGLQNMFVQPSANDAGTALGAALEAHFHVTGEEPSPNMVSAYLGPDYDEAIIQRMLHETRFKVSRRDDIESDCAELLSEGNIVCRFSGRMEYGPRALGNRSILAHPGKKDIAARLNRMKTREEWRPFGPSILSGCESEYFEDSFYTPFMLFTFDVKKDKREEVPAIVHCDGTTRPQVVDKNANPGYFKLIEEFREITSIPMVANTSFNTGYEPIVNTPEDALRNFTRLGADYLALGDYLIEKGISDRISMVKDSDIATSKVTPGDISGRRLHLRLTNKCDNKCIHCSIKDILGYPEIDTASALFEIAAGKKAGCDEIVFMRGEPTIRKDFIELVKEAASLDYKLIQIQSNGRSLSSKKYLNETAAAGVTHYALSLYGDKKSLHDSIAGVQGAFVQSVTGIRNAVKLKSNDPRSIFVTVPVMMQNYRRLPGIVAILNEIGVRSVQFNFCRPELIHGKWETSHIVTLSKCSPYIRSAIRTASTYGMSASTEAVPFCLLENADSAMKDSSENWQRFRVADLHMIHETMDEHRSESRPFAPVCFDCLKKDTCPVTWQAYQDIYGAGEFKPFLKK